MRILQLDADNISYKLIEPESSEYEKSEKKEFSFSDILVLFVSIEEGDTESTAKKAIADACAFMKKNKRHKMLLYPFAHLSSKLEKPAKAMAIFKAMEGYAAEEGVEVYHAPFGWNKQLSINVKGYPLAEQARSYEAEGKTTEKESEESQALKQEEVVKSTWYIMKEDGELVPIEKFNFKGHENLKKFADYEIKKVRAYQQTPPHVRFMQKLQLVDYEPGSDAGNMRFYPNGRLIKSLLERFVTEQVIKYGAVEVETPIMYDYGHPALKEYLHRFPARHYIVKSDDKEYFLRFSADFGQFLLVHDATISYKQLPFKFYELTRYSFRREKSGEVVGLKRLRAFTMPDMHTMCKDLEQAKEEFSSQFKFSQDILAKIGIGKEEYEAAIRFTEGFWNENKEFIQGIAKNMMKKPILIEMWNFRYAYFDPKFEFNIVDSMDKATALSTVQIDHENGKRYEMTYVDSDGKKKYPIVLHCSPSGAIERVIYALLELAYMKQAKGIAPSLPIWLAPTQVRIIPIADAHTEKCIEIAKSLQENGIRADVDDMENTLNKKIMNAEQDWIPYICVIGDKEISNSTIMTRRRGEKAQEQLTLEKLVEEIKKKVDGMPTALLSLPMLLSKRPTFVG